MKPSEDQSYKISVFLLTSFRIAANLGSYFTIAKIYFVVTMSKDTFYTVVTINWLLRSMGLSNIYRKGNHLKESKSKTKITLYVISFGLLNTFDLYFKLFRILEDRKSGLVTFSGSVQLTYWLTYFEYIVDLYFAYKNSKKSIKCFQGFDYIDTILGNACYDKIRSLITKNVILTVTIHTLISLFDYFCWILVEGWQSATVYSVDYLYFLLNMLTIIDIISHTIQVEYRLKMIGDLIQNCNTYNLNNGNNKTIAPEILQNIYRNKPLNSLKTSNTTKCLEMVWLNKCYLLLAEQVTNINDRYGLRMLVYCVNLLICIINNLNLAIRLFNGTLQLLRPYGTPTFLPCLSSIMRALNYSLMVTVLMYRCEKAYAQSERLMETVDMLLFNKDYSSVKNHLVEFRNLLMTRPIKFHAAKFFTMDYSLLVSLSSAVATYTIIILQSMK